VLIFIGLVSASAVFLSPGFLLALVTMLYTFESSGALPDGIGTIAVIAGMGFWIFRLRRRVSLTPVDFLVLALLALRCFSAIYSPDLEADVLLSAVRASAYLGGMFVLGRLVAGSGHKDTIGREWLIFMIPVAMVYSLGVRVVTGGGHRYIIENATAVGASVPIGLWVAMSATVIVTWCFGKSDRSSDDGWYRKVTKSALLMTSVLLGISYGVILLLENGTRGALIGAIAAVTMALLVCTTGRRYWIVLLLAAGSMFPLASLLESSGFISYLNGGSWGRLGRSVVDFLSLFGVDSGGKVLDASSTARVIIQSRALELFQDSVIFGQGYGSSSYYLGIYPHNIFLELAMEQGIVGVVILFALLSVVWRNLVASLMSGNEMGRIILSSAFVMLFVQYQFSFTIDNAQVLFFLIGTLASSPKERPDWTFTQEGTSAAKQENRHSLATDQPFGLSRW